MAGASYNDLANVLTYNDGTPGAITTGPLLSAPTMPGAPNVPKSSVGSSAYSSGGSLQSTPGVAPDQPNVIDPVHGAMEDAVGDTGADIIDPVGGVIGAVTGDKIICTELYARGLMPKHIYEADQAFGRMLWADDPHAMAGYHLWAPTVVRWMQSSRIVTVITRAIALPWARQMAFIMGVEPKGSALGAALMAVGLRVCRIVGRRSSARAHRAAATGAAGV